MTSRARETAGYAVGLLLALALSGAAFAAVHWRVLAAHRLMPVIFGLGLIQIIVHFRFFLHIGLRRAHRDDLLLILFSTLIVTLMAGGTLVLLFNLHERMM